MASAECVQKRADVASLHTKAEAAEENLKTSGSDGLWITCSGCRGWLKKSRGCGSGLV